MKTLQNSQTKLKHYKKHLSLLLIAAVLVVFANFTFKIIIVSGDSMSPSLHDGQIVIAFKLSHHIEVGDVVVFEQEGSLSVKRVLASSGDSVKLIAGKLYVNDIEIRPIIYEGKNVEYHIGYNELFVVGDNYPVSYDSRDYGPIQTSIVLGRIIMV